MMHIAPVGQITDPANWRVRTSRPVSTLAYTRRRMRLCFALLAAFFALVSTASAIVGGDLANRADYPSFTVVGTGCGGTLVAPDRVLTASHCRDVVEERPVVRVGPVGVTRRVRLLAMHPVYVRWTRRAQREFPPGPADLMLLQLDRPVAGVPVLPIATSRPAVGSSVVTIGRGSTSPDPGAGSDGKFRRGVVSVVGNSTCADELPDAATREWSVCTRDPRQADASFKGPFVSACFGDSGGPLIFGVGTAARLAGVVSWGPACGSQRDTEIYADAAAGRAFVLARRPVWAPRLDGRPRIVGTPRAGSTLRCDVTWLARPDRASIDFNLNGRQVQSSSARTYRVRRADRGQRVQCDVGGSTAGGRYGSPLSRAVRIAQS